jgi:perosamine synthetase
MTDIQGALGVGQMQKAAAIMASRREGAARYDELLADVPWLQLPFRHPEYVHGFQSYVCLFEPECATAADVTEAQERRDALMAALEGRGISTRQGTHAAAHTAYYARKYDITPQDYPNAYVAERLTITLPLYAGMARQETQTVVTAVLDAGKTAARVGD